MIRYDTVVGNSGASFRGCKKDAFAGYYLEHDGKALSQGKLNIDIFLIRYELNL